MGQNLTKKEINKLKTCTPQTIKAIFNQSNIQKTDTKGNTLLHLICLTNPSQQIVEYFLLCGIDINTKNNKGYTPLHSLCCSKSPITIGVMRVFILKGAKVNECNCFGETPLHFACFNNSINIEIFKYLVESGSNVNSLDKKKKTPIFSLCQLPDPDLLKIQILLQHGANISVKDKNGRSPFHILLSNINNLQVLQFFVKNLQDLNVQDNKLLTPLHYFFKRKKCKKKLLKCLIEAGIKIKITDAKGNTPFHYLAKFQKKKKGLATILIENGGDPNLKNFRGITVFKICKKKSNLVVKNEIEEFFSKNHNPNFKELTKNQNNSKIDKTILKEIDNIVTFQEILPKEITILRRVGNGSFKEVYEGIWNNKCVAVAKLIEGKKFSENQLNDFTQEIITVCNLNHPNIIKFYGGYLKDVSNIMIICEFCRGGDLYEFLHSKQELTPKQKIQIALDIAYGIEYLHSKKLVHRDLKTPNVLFSEDGKIKIADFGLSKTMSLSNTLINHTIVGTPRWMAPELLRGEQNYTDKVDIYSFGIILWEISTGKIPFEGFGTFQLSGLVGYQGKRPQINESDLFYELIIKCWGQDQEDRPSIQRIVSELELLKSQRY
ncbi:mitogen-activated protein kinase kinase kinase [Anaeramoeba flamelloides]|uniref:Mitogen-activated protein kinase kinase kinase n=1 Tax=Anaeramoeba flamelloides TaxID=1746091 RepID=A0AAV7ZDI4_9EUKA|nr:mitogen-activated protein kinase kinase kinase [Anaeramoeba flamelloides]